MTKNLNKQITLITGYYYPEDTAIGLYNTQMMEYLENKGYLVNVITGFPSYPQWKIRDSYKNKKPFLIEENNQCKIYRYKQYVPATPTFLKRILLLTDFTIGSFFNILKIKKCDVVISVVPHTSTILLGWLLKHRTNSKLWNHIQDFEFDAAKQTGISSNTKGIKKIIFKLLFKTETWLLNKGDLNSTISFSMVDKLNKKSKKESFYFPNWIDANKIDPSKLIQHNYMKSASFKILYSGNIGEKQDWQFFLSFAKRIEAYNAEIILVGDGAKKQWLCNKIEEFKNVKYYEPIEYKDLSNLLCSADLHILFQKNNVVDSVMPSKLLGMMASAKPSLIAGNVTSEVKKIIEESKGGFYISNESVSECVSIVDYLIKNPKEVINLGFSARNYIITKFSAEKVLSNFEDKLSQIFTEKF